MRRKGSDILDPFPQRRQWSRENADAVPQILAKGPPGDHVLKVSVGRGHDTDIGPKRSLAADPFEGSRLRRSFPPPQDPSARRTPR
jgi:hypothetical protein